MIHPHTKFKTVQDFILYKVNLEDAELDNYARALWKLPTKKRPAQIASLLRFILP